jgi:hypothetical protein
VEIVVPMRHFLRGDLFRRDRIALCAVVLAAATCLSACAGSKFGFPGSTPQSTAESDAVMPSEATAPSAAPVDVASLDPLNVPPPGPTPTTTMTDPLLVPPPSSTPPSIDSSQRVPLGTFGAAPPAGAPVSITQPPAKAQPAAQVATAPAQTPPPAVENKLETPVVEPARAATAPVVMPRAAAPAPKAAWPLEPGPAAEPAPTPAPLQLRVPTSRGTTTAMVSPDPRVGSIGREEPEPQETVIISSDNTRTVIPQTREFVPASVLPTQSAPVRGLGDMQLIGAQRNVVERFETLRRLQEEGLITADEFGRRRNANIGALLPYTREPGAMGLERSVPSGDAIVARLVALRRSFEMRAITATQHALERTMILNALLPENPDDRTDRRPPPADVIEGAAVVGHLDMLRSKNLITSQELDAEKNAIEHVLRTGLLPSQETAASGGKKAPAKTAAAAKPKAAGSDAAAAEAAVSAEITGPVLHLASFRSEAAAKQGWQEAQSHNKAALGSLKPIIRKVDLGAERGIFYRLMTGPFNTLSDAEAVCIQLKQNNQFCRASADGN